MASTKIIDITRKCLECSAVFSYRYTGGPYRKTCDNKKCVNKRNRRTRKWSRASKEAVYPWNLRRPNIAEEGYKEMPEKELSRLREEGEDYERLEQIQYANGRVTDEERNDGSWIPRGTVWTLARAMPGDPGKACKDDVLEIDKSLDLIENKPIEQKEPGDPATVHEYILQWYSSQGIEMYGASTKGSKPELPVVGSLRLTRPNPPAVRAMNDGFSPSTRPLPALKPFVWFSGSQWPAQGRTGVSLETDYPGWADDPDWTDHVIESVDIDRARRFTRSDDPATLLLWMHTGNSESTLDLFSQVIPQSDK